MRTRGFGIKSICLSLALIGFTGFMDAPAVAELVTFNFSGTITELDDTNNVFDGNVGIGDTFTGSLIYATGATDADSGPNQGFYVYRSTTTPPVGPPIGLTIHIGSVSIQPNYDNAFFISVFNDVMSTEGLADGIVATSPTSLDGATNISGALTNLELVDLSHSLYSSDALPTSLNVANFDLGQIFIADFVNNENHTLLRGTLNGLQAVPEPTSVVLLGLGALGLGVGALRRRHA